MTFILLIASKSTKHLSFLQIMRDPDTGNSRGFGFISYDSFQASDAAIDVMLSKLNVQIKLA
jgi:RNA recognition motif-containing protein